jgi:hypothetical protein
MNTTGTKKHYAWDLALMAYLRQAAGQRFAWGQNDCARFAAGAVQAQTGQPVALPQWANRREAIALLRQHGSLQAAVDAYLPRRKAPAYAQRGDVVLVRAPAAPHAFLAVADAGLWWAPSRKGLITGPLRHARVAWAVGLVDLAETAGAAHA